MIQRFAGVGAAGAAPVDELDGVDPAVAVLDLVDGAGGEADRLGQAALGVARVHTQLVQTFGQPAVRGLVLRLGFTFGACCHLRSKLWFGCSCFEM